MEHQELLSGFIRLHVLHHAAEGDLYGQWMIEELARHGYRVSPGTLYPMLHAQGVSRILHRTGGPLASAHLQGDALRDRGAEPRARQDPGAIS